MPRLILFAPCEKVIVDENLHTTSLIVLLEALNIAVPESEQDKIPKDAVIPFSWHVIALWRHTPEDEGKKLEGRFEVFLPTGETLGIKGTMDIDFQPGKPNFRNVVNILGFPLHPLLKTDECIFKLFFREKGDENEWQFAADFPVIIVHGENHESQKPA
jgi:hypothetical protein